MMLPHQVGEGSLVASEERLDQGRLARWGHFAKLGFPTLEVDPALGPSGSLVHPTDHTGNRPPRHDRPSEPLPA